MEFLTLFLGSGSLWATDGTAEGTRHLVTLPREYIPSDAVPPAAPLFARAEDAHPNRAVFFASPSELWASDGTVAGTRRILELPEGTVAQGSHLFPLDHGRALFVEDTGSGLRVAVTDGTPEGTFTIGDLQAMGSQLTYVSFQATGGGRALFNGWSPETGHELYVTDGTPGSIRLVKDLNPGPADSFPGTWSSPSNVSSLVLPDGRLLFTATDAEAGWELWITDGTAPGTFRVTDLVPGPGGASPRDFEMLGDGRVVFSALHGTVSEPGLFVTDGSAAGTRLLTALGEAVWLGGWPGAARLGDGRLVFANAGPEGARPWVTDGSPDGTGPLGDAVPIDWPSVFRSLPDGRVMFFGLDAGSGEESVFVTDGAPEGTQLALTVSAILLRYETLVDLGQGRFVLVADDGDVAGFEPWGLDLGVPAMFPLGDIWPGVDSSIQSWEMPLHARPDGLAVFVADDGQIGRQIFATDGSPEGTLSIASQDGRSFGSAPKFVARFPDGRVLFSASVTIEGVTERDLWVTDGTAAGTLRLTPADGLGMEGHQFDTAAIGLLPDGRLVLPVLVPPFASGIYPPPPLPPAWVEPLVTDGTPEGTHILADLRPGPDGSGATGFQALPDGRLLFVARTGFTPFADEPWTTDGTEAGTRPLRGADERAVFSASRFASLDERGLVFVGRHADLGAGVFVTDGSFDGTERVLALPNSLASQLAAAGPRVLFGVRENSVDVRYWSTDGTVAGTQAILTGPSSWDSSLLQVLGTLPNGRSVFATTGPTGRGDPFATDGTAAGTERLLALPDDPFTGFWRGKSYGPLMAIDGERALLNVRAMGEQAVWVTDGTAAGTEAIAVRFPWLADENPVWFLAAENGRYLFAGRPDPGGPEALFVTDLTEGGTHPLSLFVSGTWHGIADGLLRLASGRYLLVAKTEPDGGPRLFATDLTLAGTSPLFAAGENAPSGSPWLHGLADGARAVIAFSDSSGLSGDYWWLSDGTPGGTVRYPGEPPHSDGFTEIWNGDGPTFGIARDPRVGQEPAVLTPQGFATLVDLNTAGPGFGRVQFLLTLAASGASFSITPLHADRPEGQADATPFTFLVTRAGSLAAAATVAWSVTGSGAQPADAADFMGGVLPSGVLSFAPGEASVTLTVLVAGDRAFEPDEGFLVTLSDPSAGTLGTATASGVIRNDDARLSLVESLVALPEGSGGGVTAFTFTVRREGDASGPARLDWRAWGTGGAPADAADFAGGVLPSGRLVFAPGETERTITVEVLADDLVERTEQFTLGLFAPRGAELGTARALGRILNDDAAFHVAGVGTGKAEGNARDQPFVFTVWREGDLSAAAQLAWSVEGEGPHPADAADFASGVLPSGTLDFAPGVARLAVPVMVAADRVVELDEGFLVRLTHASGAGIAVATASGVILNDDGGVLGTAGDDVRRGTAGKEVILGGAGDDLILASPGPDTVDGGAGVDTISYAEMAGRVAVQLGAPGWGNTRGTGVQVLRDIENVIGSPFADHLWGDDGPNRLEGEAGNDILEGGGGDDTLLGGEGHDRLIGGPGADVLFGGPGPDHFEFRAIGDSAPGAPDLVMDFSRAEGDRIRLREMDADPLTPGVPPWMFSAAGLTGVAGQVTAVFLGDQSEVLADLDGDGAADFRVVVMFDQPLVRGDLLL